MDSKQKKELNKRIKYVIGHLSAIEKMIEDGRDSSEIYAQLRAVESAFSKSVLETFEKEHRLELAERVVEALENCPGPFLITAAFIGYKMGGVFGALLATFAMFSPSFVMTLIFSEVFVRIRSFKPVRGALAGVLASFVGMLAFVILQLSGATLKVPAAFVFAATAFVAVRWFDMDVLGVFGGGLVVWVFVMAIHLV